MASIRRIIARSHPERKKGFAQIELIGENLSPDGIDIVIARTERGSKEFLCPAKGGGAKDAGAKGGGDAFAWRTDEGFAVSLECVSGGGGVLITLGPEVIQHMDQQSNYGFTFSQRGQPLGPERSVSWRDVAPVEKADVGGKILLSAQSADRTAPVGPAHPEPTAGLVEETGPAASPEVAPSQPEPTVGAVGTAQGDLPPPPIRTNDPGRSVPMIIGGVAVALLAAGAVAYVLLFGGETDDAPPTEPPSIAAPAPKEPAAPPSSGNPLEEIVRKSPEEIVAEARRYRDRGQIAEAQALLRAAGDKGSADALRQLGQVFDPTDLTPGRTTQAPEPDVGKAYAYYRQAIGKGSEDAKADLGRLRATVEKLARDGDAEAAKLLGRWVE